MTIVDVFFSPKILAERESGKDVVEPLEELRRNINFRKIYIRQVTNFTKW